MTFFILADSSQDLHTLPSVGSPHAHLFSGAGSTCSMSIGYSWSYDDRMLNLDPGERLSRESTTSRYWFLRASVLVPESLGPVGADPVVERDPSDHGVEQALLLRYEAERDDPRYQPGLYLLVGAESGQPLYIPSGEIHHYRLRHIVQVVSGGKVLCTDLVGHVVHAFPPEYAAVRARAVLPGMRGDLVHGEVHRLPERSDMQGDVVVPAVSLDDVDARRPVSPDPLVYGDAVDLHILPLLESLV